jgi:hypothetical protein
MDGLVSRASMIRLSLHPLPASETSAFNKKSDPAALPRLLLHTGVI